LKKIPLIADPFAISACPLVYEPLHKASITVNPLTSNGKLFPIALQL
jgi:hypothetical protein